MKFKEGVSVKVITKECIQGIVTLSHVMSQRCGRQFTITSVCDGKHKIGSKHYTGNAFDVRTWTSQTSGIQLSPEEKQSLALEFVQALGDDWDVVIERTHIHVEYDPK